MMNKSPEEQIADWCRHFNGVMNDKCKAGIRYDDVQGTGKLPCIKSYGCADKCSSVSFLSEQEVKEEAEKLRAHAAKFLTELAEGKTCPHCHKPIEERYQVGRSVYAHPCGCRQYQGRLPKGDKRP